MKIKRAFVPDIQLLGRLCEANYMRLHKLLKNFELGSEQKVFIETDASHNSYVCLTITESFPYTSTIQVSQHSPTSQWLKAPEMLVRLYHDANMAEVVSYQKQHRIRGHYHYPNPEMRMPDEKIQLNQFLTEWLTHCLSHGRSAYEFDYSQALD